MLRPNSKGSNLVGLCWISIKSNETIQSKNKFFKIFPYCLRVKTNFLKLPYCAARLENYCSMQYSLAFIQTFQHAFEFTYKDHRILTLLTLVNDKCRPGH